MKTLITKGTVTVDLVKPGSEQEIETVTVNLRTITQWGKQTEPNGDVGYEDESETYVESHYGPDWVTEDMIKENYN